ncbi:hypothetical protein J6590_098714 [Homalodisca vitripennis]|nr:hypothetical protein J6590_050026 [Homalodisca vitripennis]KAG8284639.1 hypothetical protein J6590_098714 [Homalodisca vitripennis]
MLIWKLPSTEEEAVVFFQQRGLLPVTKLCEGRLAVKYFGEQYPFWKCNVKPCKKKVGFRVGNTIVVDCWKEYKTSELESAGFEYYISVNHSYNFVDPETGANTQRVERMCGSAKWRNKVQRRTRSIIWIPTWRSTCSGWQ